MEADEPVPEIVPSLIERGVAGSTPSAGTTTSVDSDQPPGQRDRRSRRLVGAIVGLVIVGIGTGLAVVLLGASATIPTGSGTATITWKSVPGSSVPVGRGYPSDHFTRTLTPPPQPFSGTIDALSVKGVATRTPSALNTGTFGKFMQRQLFRWKGTFDGSAFNLGLYIKLTNELGGLFFRVTGNWGTERVSVIAPYQDHGSPIAFHGTIGALKVSGTVHRPKDNKRYHVVVIRFTVSK